MTVLQTKYKGINKNKLLLPTRETIICSMVEWSTAATFSAAIKHCPTLLVVRWVT